MPFSAEYLIYRHVRMDRRTDRWTDELIRVELGNLSVPFWRVTRFSRSESTELSISAIRFCKPEFSEIGKRYPSSAYFFPFLNSPLEEIMK